MRRRRPALTSDALVRCAFAEYDAGDRYISEMLAVRPDNGRSGRGPVMLSRSRWGTALECRTAVTAMHVLCENPVNWCG